ncbi:MAG: hypothetical protein PHC94_07170 [Methylobacter sp.]|nr:hypothetical protein [Methylococcales bacterium]MDD5113781.1 hypothetical protein [Methylobacter sp.]
MNLDKPLAAGLLLSLTTLTAEAALTPGFSIADGQPVVYSSVSDITWTGDANLLDSLVTNQGYSTVVNAIIAASPTIYDTPDSGAYSLSAGDFSRISSGVVTSWFGARAFTTYLNSINYAGSNQWALPSAGANPQYGYNPTGSQFGQLYYSELNKLAFPGTNGSNYGILGNGDFQSSGSVGPFSNVQSYVYWLGTEFALYPELYPDSVWVFDTRTGDQWDGSKGAHLPVWAVSPGQVPAVVPVPGAAWLFGSGLMGLAGLRRPCKTG